MSDFARARVSLADRGMRALSGALVLLLLSFLATACSAANSKTLAASPSSVAFGTVVVGYAQSSTVKVTNTGAGNLVLQGVSLTDSSHFSATAWTAKNLAPGASATTTVTFKPSVAAAYTAQLTVLTNASSAPVVALSGTGGASTTIQPVSVSISPQTATLTSGSGPAQFTATVLGSTNTSVTWSLSGVGAFTYNGNTATYTPPLSGTGSATLTATSVADTTKSASAAITVAAPATVSVAINPTSATVQAGSQTAGFTATVSGSTNTGVTWSLSGIGSLSYSGNSAIYTPPTTGSGSATVTAASVADPSKSASAAVTVTAPSTGTISVSVSPSSATVAGGASQQFSATVSGTTNTGVNWLVNGIAGGNSSLGSISSTGLYTAPACGSVSSVTVSALSAYDGTTKGNSSVTVGADPSNYHFVATNGSDSNDGSACHPWLTLQHAANSVNPGDTVIVRDGTYSNASLSGSGSKLVNMSRGGSSSAWIVFRAEHQWAAVLDGLNNTTEEGWAFASTASYIRVEGFEIKGFSATGITNWGGGTNIQLARNNIHDIGRFCTDTTNGRVGIFVHAGPMLVEQNVIHDIGRYSPGENGCSPSTTYYQNNDHGLYIETASNVTVRNNVFHHNIHGWSVHIYPDSVSNVLILNNTFAFPNPWRPGHIVINAASITGSRIENNIFYQPTTAAIYRKYTSTPTSDSLTIANNVSTVKLAELYTSTTTYDPSLSGWTYSANQENTDPLLANPSSDDFHLATGSPAIGAGASLSQVTNDYNGNPRANPPSIGAYEWPSLP